MSRVTVTFKLPRDKDLNLLHSRIEEDMDWDMEMKQVRPHDPRFLLLTIYELDVEEAAPILDKLASEFSLQYRYKQRV